MMKEKYETLPLTTLKELAKARGLKGISTMKKAQVIELMLQEDEKEQEKEKQEKRETVKEMSANTGDKEIHDIDRHCCTRNSGGYARWVWIYPK